MAQVIRYFEKLDESLAGEQLLPPLDIEVLRGIFKVTEGDPMYDSFPVNPDKAKSLATLVTCAFDFDFERFEYFLEYEE